MVVERRRGRRSGVFIRINQGLVTSLIYSMRGGEETGEGMKTGRRSDHQGREEE